MTSDSRLKGESLKRLRDILLKSFKLKGLDELCQQVLLRSLSDVTSHTGTGEIVAKQLLDRAQEEGVLFKLVRRAAWTQPENSQIEAVLRELWPPLIPVWLLVRLEKLLSALEWETLEKAHAPMADCPQTWNEDDPVAERRFALIEALADRKQGAHGYPLLEFVLRVSSLVGNAPSTKLKAWVSKAAAALKVPADVLKAVERRVKTEVPVTPLYLLIKIDPVEEEKPPSFEIVAWLSGQGGEACDKVFGGDGRRYLREEMDAQIAAILRTVESRWSDRLLAAGDNLFIEFFLPRSMLSKPFDCVDVDFGGPKPIWLGTRYAVVVRPSERLANEPNSRSSINYKQKWEEFLARSTGSNATLWITEAAKAQSNAVSRALSHPRPFSVGLTLPAEDSQPGSPDIIMDCIIRPGIPIALWPRRSTCKGNPEKDMRLLLEHVSELVRQVTNFRSTAFDSHPDPHFGGYLTVLWDDPGRIPNDLRRE